MAVWVREWDGGKGGKKAWWVFVKQDGKRKAKRIGPGPEGRRTAMVIAEKLTAKIALGEFQLNDEPRLTLAQYAATWLEHTVYRTVRLTTAVKYHEVMRVHWLPALGETALADLTRQVIRAQVVKFQQDGYQNNTIRFWLNVLQSCLGCAMDDGHLTDNPARQSTRGLMRGQAGRQKSIEVFTRPSLQELMAAAERKGPMTHAMIMTLARTGLRISELMGLRVEDLDFERRVLHVRRTWGNTSRGPEYYGQPKSGYRPVDMSRQLCATLQAYIPTLPGDGWLFPSSHGRPAVPNTFYAVHWKPLFKDAGLPYRHPHVLRHTFATHLLWQGETPVYVKEQLGHASIKITVDLYGQHIRTWGKAAVDKLDDLTADGSSEVKSWTSKSAKGLKIVKGGV
jgi:integrase